MALTTAAPSGAVGPEASDDREDSENGVSRPLDLGVARRAIRNFAVSLRRRASCDVGGLAGVFRKKSAFVLPQFVERGRPGPLSGGHDGVGEGAWVR
jgi:hypothetical protein